MVLVLLSWKGAPSFGRVLCLVKVLRLRGPVAEVLASGGGPRFAAVFVGCQLTFPVTWQPSQSSHCHLALDHVHVSPRAKTCSHDFLTSQDQLNRIFCSLQAETQPVVRQSGSCQLLRTSNHVLMWEG